MSKAETLLACVKEKFANKLIEANVEFGEATISVAKEDLIEVCTQLRDDNDLTFQILIDLCGVDYSTYGMTEWTTEDATGSGFSRGVSRPADLAYEAEVDAGRRFAVVYHLLSIKHNHRIRLRVFTDSEQPLVHSVTEIWSGANWFEREAFDLYGILFEEHPDLRRLLTDYGFIGFPFRKDFPLSGYVEMRYDDKKKRVVYEPVDIEPRVLVPRVIRDDHRYINAEQGEK